MKLKSFYFMIMTAVGLIGLLIGYGTAIYSTIQGALISDEEYLAGSYYYSDYECNNQWNWNPETQQEERTEMTEEEKEQCIQKEKEKTLNQRSYDAKQSSIGGITWGSLFLLIFIFHGTIFFKKDKGST